MKFNNEIVNPSEDSIHANQYNLNKTKVDSTMISNVLKSNNNVNQQNNTES